MLDAVAGAGSGLGFGSEFGRGFEAEAKVRGWFHFVHEDKDGNVLNEWDIPNQTTLAGLDHMLSVEFAGTTQVTTWYLGLVDNSGFTALAAADTAASHAGWTENTNWTGTPRPTITFGASTGGANVVTNASQVTFTFSTSGNNIRGAFVITDSTKGGTAGIIYSEAANGAGPIGPFNSTDVLKVTYSNSLTAA